MRPPAPGARPARRVILTPQASDNDNRGGEQETDTND